MVEASLKPSTYFVVESSALTDCEAPPERPERVTPRPKVITNPDTDLDMDIDVNADTDTDTTVPLKKVDKGKGKAMVVDLNEEPAPKVC